MNPHFIFNVLTSINLFIVQNETEKASDYLNQFSNLIRRILDNSRKEWVTLAEELSTLKLYIEIEQLRFSDTFAFEICVEEGMETDFIEIPSMLIQPYVENAIWHGLMQKKNPPRNIWINIQKIDTHLRIEIRDNGIGRAAAQALKSKSVTTRQSHGLAVTEARISLLKTLYQLDCKVEIEDLAQGTSVQLYWDMAAH
jgi:LytS/YehU family sensor histidine kinase